MTPQIQFYKDTLGKSVTLYNNVLLLAEKSLLSNIFLCLLFQSILSFFSYPLEFRSATLKESLGNNNRTRNISSMYRDLWNLDCFKLNLVLCFHYRQCEKKFPMLQHLQQNVEPFNRFYGKLFYNPDLIFLTLLSPIVWL